MASKILIGIIFINQLNLISTNHETSLPILFLFSYQPQLIFNRKTEKAFESTDKLSPKAKSPLFFVSPIGLF